VNSLKNNFLFQLTTSIIQIAAPIVTFPYLSRTLGPENIGKISFIDYTAQIILLIASFGIPLYGVREISKVQNDKKEIRKITSELVIIHLFFSIIAVFIFILLIYLSPAVFVHRTLVILSVINIIINGLSLHWLVQGLEDFKFLAKCSISIKIVTVTAIFYLVNKASDYHIYYLILILSSCLLVLLDLLYAFSKGYFFVKAIKPIRHLSGLSIFFVTTVTISLYTYLDTYILGILTGSLAVGLFTTALKIVKLSLNFVNDLSWLLLPRVTSLIENKNNKEIERLLNKSLSYVLTLSIPLSIFIYISAPEVIKLLAGSQFEPSIQTLKILSLLPVINGISNIYIFQLFFPFGKEKKVLLTVAAGSVVSIALNILLAPIYRHNGAAIACIISELIITIFIILASKKLIKLHFSSVYIGKILITCILFYPIIIFTRIIISNNTFHALFASGVFCFFVYVLFQRVIFSNTIVTEIIDYFLKYLIKEKKVNT
jgi:O-antigen/teichoic acid export membrane protein